MRKFILAVFLIVLSFSFNETTHVENVWWNAKRNSKVKIFKNGDKYYGKIVWLERSNDENGNPRTDKLNPDASLRNRSLIDLVVLRDFSQGADMHTLEGGTAYDPTSGRTYCAKISFDGTKLKLKGGVCGFSLVSGSTVWELAQ